MILPYHVEFRVRRVRNKALVVFVDLLRGDGEDDGVLGPGEGVDAVVGNVGGVVDAAVVEHLASVRDKGIHAVTWIYI